MKQMERVILMGHGSPRKEANTIHLIAKLLQDKLYPVRTEECVKVSYLQFADPDIMTAIKGCVEEGATRVILHPFFLSPGVHVTRDIPEMIAWARRLFPHVEFIYTEPLGTHEKLVEIVAERIRSAVFSTPPDIEARSFAVIDEETDLSDVPAEQLPIVHRVIHATADFDFKDSLIFGNDAVKTGVEAIRTGKDIVTDVEMVRTGISKKLLGRWGGKVTCAIADDDVAYRSGETGKTRAELAIEKTFPGCAGIVVVGNAPTALLKAIELVGALPEGSPKPLLIGVPVGFVKALESKALLAVQKFPFITNLSRKGGTPVAVAIVNALLKMASE
jgi:precorrin-8X/cobalt-precorrin-8 methylmutase